MVKTLYADSFALKEKIASSGMKIGYICEILGLSRQGFNKKINGFTPFRAVEVFALCVLLSIPEPEKDKIFLPKKATTELTEVDS